MEARKLIIISSIVNTIAILNRHRAHAHRPILLYHIISRHNIKEEDNTQHTQKHTQTEKIKTKERRITQKINNRNSSSYAKPPHAMTNMVYLSR